MKRFLCMLMVFLSAGVFAQDAQAKNPVRLQLPDGIYAVPGVEMNVYFDNITCTITPGNYVFDVTCRKGRNNTKFWTYTPKPEDVGTYDWSVKVINDSGVVAEASTKLHVAPADAGKDKDITVLLVGDSLTHGHVYPTRIFNLFQQPDNPKFHMIGSNGPKGVPQPDGVAHEGWACWMWDTFVHRAEPRKVKNPQSFDIASRFLYKVDGKPQLDFKKYFEQYGNGRVPDIITFQLGVNDIAGANDENVHRRCEAILKNADELIAAARAGAPEAIMGVGLVTPGCSSQEGFGHDYNCGLTRWQYKKNQHTLNAAMLKHFADYPDKKVFIIPTSLNLDCENNFPVFKGVQCNGVHPTAAGYNQMGDTYYSWMKYWLAK